MVIEIDTAVLTPKEAKASIQKLTCDGCSGSGDTTDAESGDISWDTYECDSCKGTGWKLIAVVAKRP